MLLASMLIAAQSGAQSLPPVRALTTPVTTATTTFYAGARVKVLADGRVVVGDAAYRTVSMVDTNLSMATIIYDKDTPAPLTYPTVPQVLFSGPGDSTWLTDLPARGFRVLSSDGRVVRRQTFADPIDGPLSVSTDAGTTIAPGHLMYFGYPLEPAPGGGFGGVPHDSLFLVRVNFDTRKRDTVGIINHITPARSVVIDSAPSVGTGSGYRPTRIVTTWQPFDVGDAMAMNSLGMLAVIRAADFHVDWLMPDGTWRKSPPPQWPWHTLSADEKRSLMDQVTKKIGENAMTLSPIGTQRPEVSKQIAPIPDRLPAFAPMSAIPDRDGRIWVQLGAKTLTQVDGPPTYAAIDTAGQIVDRISFPVGHFLAGFGPRGSVFAVARNGKSATLERYALRP
jgi:hypothetical protein